jgi:hypothetical protein
MKTGDKSPPQTRSSFPGFFPLAVAFPSLRSHRRFPVASIKMLDFKYGQIHAFNASQVHVDLIGIGARNVKRGDTAARAEMMFGGMRVEGVCSEVLPGRQQAEPFPGNYPVDISFFGADRAVALRNPAVDGPNDFVGNAPAMASAAVDRAVLELIRHKVNLTQIERCGKYGAYPPARVYAKR